MPFDLQLPDGTILQDVPDGTTKAQIQQKLNLPKNGNNDLQATFDVKKTDNDKLAAGLIRKVGSGGTFGTADEIGAGLEAGGRYAGAKALQGVDYINKQLGGNSLVSPEGQAIIGQSLGDQYNKALASNRDDLNYAQQQAPIASLGAELVGALGTGGLGAGTKGSTAIANSLRSGALPARVAKGALLGATSGGLYGFGEGEGEGRIDNAATNAIYGAATGGALPIAGAAVKGTANAVIPSIDKGVAALAQRAQDLGIPLRADQLSPTRARNTVQKVSQELPFSGVNAFEDTQRNAVQKVLAKSIGQDADNLSPDVVNNYLKDAKVKFRAGLGNEPVNFDEASLSRLDDIPTNADVTNDVKDIVKNTVDRFKADLSGNYISPEKLSSFRSDLIKRIPKADSQARPYLSDIVDVIDDIAEKHAPEGSSQILGQARREYRNFKTIEPLLERSPDGNINPVDLINRVAASPYIKASRTSLGEDDLVDIARIAKQFLPKKAGSDTIQKGAYIAGGASLANPATAAATTGTVLGNAAFQKLYNQSPKIVNAILKKAQSGQLTRVDLDKAFKDKKAQALLQEIANANPTIGAEAKAAFNNKK